MLGLKVCAITAELPMGFCQHLGILTAVRWSRNSVTNGQLPRDCLVAVAPVKWCFSFEANVGRTGLQRAIWESQVSASPAQRSVGNRNEDLEKGCAGEMSRLSQREHWK